MKDVSGTPSDFSLWNNNNDNDTRSFFTNLPTIFGGHHILLPRYCDYYFKRSSENFSVTSKLPQEFSNKSETTTGLWTLERTHQGVANSFG